MGYDAQLDHARIAKSFEVLVGAEVSKLNETHFTNVGDGTAGTPANAIITGVGTSAAPCSSGAAGQRHLEFLCKSTATSGDNRLGYFRYEIGGAGGGGECLRAFTVLTAAVDTARGAHLSLVPSTGGSIAGLGTAISGTLHLPDAGLAAGTWAAIEAQVWCETGDTNGNFVASHGIFRATVGGGDAAQEAKVLHLMDVDAANCSAADATKMISTVSLAELPAGTVGLRVRINGADYYLPAVAVAEWN